MAQFVLVINDVPTAGFDKIMKVVTDSNNAIRFIPNGINTLGVTTPGMHGPDPKSSYSGVRLEFQHNAVDKAADILKVFAGLSLSNRGFEFLLNLFAAPPLRALTIRV